MKTLSILSGALLLFGSLVSCKKYLDATPDSNLIIPSSVADLQELLDNYKVVNQSYPNAVEILSDDYYLSTSGWTGIGDMVQRNLHIWEKDDNTQDYWNACYATIFTANIVLDELPEIEYTPDQQGDWDNVKGSAFFIRGYYFYALSQLFMKPYNSSTSENDLGIVLRLNSDINEASKRASIEQTYQQMINDFRMAAGFLPIIPFIKTRPSRPAAYGALARTFLAMNQYDSAGKYANLCLSLHDSLIDYNDILNPSGNFPIPRFNEEVIFNIRTPITVALSSTRAKVDSNLYNSYDNFDLRKTILYATNSNGIFFKGDYDRIGTTGSTVNSNYAFPGIVTDEMYLIRAESYARAGDTALALADLNTLLAKRYITGSFTPVTATDVNDALVKIVNERRKELYRRGTRWTDLRRFMNEPQFITVPTRILNSQTYFMTTTSDPYIMLLPRTVIDLTGMLQN